MFSKRFDTKILTSYRSALPDDTGSGRLLVEVKINLRPQFITFKAFPKRS